MFEIAGFDFRGEEYILDNSGRDGYRLETPADETDRRPEHRLRRTLGLTPLAREELGGPCTKLKKAGPCPLLLGGEQEHAKNRRMRRRAARGIPGTSRSGSSSTSWTSATSWSPRSRWPCISPSASANRWCCSTTRSTGTSSNCTAAARSSSRTSTVLLLFAGVPEQLHAVHLGRYRLCQLPAAARHVASSHGTPRRANSSGLRSCTPWEPTDWQAVGILRGLDGVFFPTILLGQGIPLGGLRLPVVSLPSVRRHLRSRAARFPSGTRTPFDGMPFFAEIQTEVLLPADAAAHAVVREGRAGCLLARTGQHAALLPCRRRDVLAGPFLRPPAYPGAVRGHRLSHSPDSW